MRKGFNRDGAKCWEYVLVYSDDLLVIARNPGEILAHVDQHFKLKDGSVQSPTSYLGADVGKHDLPDGSEAWFLSSNSYVQEAVQNVESWRQKWEKDNSGWRSLKTKTSCMFPSLWKPELDVSLLLNQEDASYYQQQIGVLCWMCELGRVDINNEISMLAAFCVAPR
jgi:hypothetical protein